MTQPTQPQDKPLSIDDLKKMLMQQHGSEAAKYAVRLTVSNFIKEQKMPYRLVESDDGILNLKMVGDSTEAFLERFITVNEEMLLLKQDVAKLALLDSDKDQLLTILISGPTGTGKEILARALHGDRPGEFVALNCAGLPTELVESELFGHVKGAFTGAIEPKKGLMKVANKGTIFLDEIGELPLQVQSKLLRVIQEREIRPVGSNLTEKVSCRVVCATHRNLRLLCDHERFRIDLYARISTFELHTTALEHRKDDIEHIISAMEGGKEFLTNVPKALIEKIDLSMNVRSLQQAIKRYTVLNKLP